MPIEPRPGPKTSLSAMAPSTGLAEHLDARHVPNTALLTAQNLRLDRKGRYAKRKGVAPFCTADESGAMSGAGEGFEVLATRDKELVHISADGLRSRSSVANAFVRRGPGIQGNIEELAVSKAEDGTATRDLYKSAHNIDCASGGGFRAYVWNTQETVVPITPVNGFLTPKGSASLVVVESATGQVVFRRQLYLPDVTQARVVYLSTLNRFVVVFQYGNQIYAQTFDPTGVIDSASLLAPVSVVTIATPTNPLFDACECENEGGYFYVATQDSGVISATKVTPTGSPVGTTYSMAGAISLAVPTSQKFALSMCATKSESVVVMASFDDAGTNKLWMHRFAEPTAGGTSVYDGLVATAPTTTTKFVVSGCCRISASRAVVCYSEYERNDALLTYGPVTCTATVDTSAVGGSAVVRSGSDRATPWTLLVSRPVLVSGKVHAWLNCHAPGVSAVIALGANSDTSDVTFQTMALCDMRYDAELTDTSPFTGTNAAALPIGAALCGTAGWLATPRGDSIADGFLQTLPTTTPYDAVRGDRFIAYPGLVAGTTYAVTSLHHITTFSRQWAGTAQAFQVGPHLVYGGALPGVYDGAKSGELGFLFTPWSVTRKERIAGGDLPATDGGTNSYTYSYKYCFARTLSDGSIVRSPMSNSTTASYVAGANLSIEIHVPMVGLSAWFDPAQDGTSYDPGTCLEIYRSVGLSPTAGPPIGSNTFTLYARVISFQEKSNRVYRFVDDGSIERPNGAAEPFDDLLRIQPPSFVHTILHENRIWGIHGDLLYFSSEVTPAELPIFAAEFTIPVPGGSPTALGSLDDKLIIFSRKGIYELAGHGPSLTLLDNDFGAPRQVSTDSGCLDPKSVVKTPFGVGYRSNAGLCLLDRGLNVNFSGLPVQDTLDDDDIILDSAIDGDQMLLYFLTENYRLVFDYLENAWFKDVFETGVGAPKRVAVSREGAVYTLHATGAFAQSAVSFDTSAASANLWVYSEMIFGRFSSAGLEGWQRFRSADCLFLRRGACTLTMQYMSGYQAAVDTDHPYTEADVVARAPTVGYIFAQQISSNAPMDVSGQIRIADGPPAIIGASGDAGEGLWFLGMTIDFEAVSGTNRTTALYQG